MGPRQTDDSRPAHVGYVAGRYRNGALSDIWTEVERCAERTFLAYVPACSCGWVGTGCPATPTGLNACRREWATGHGASLDGPVRADDDRPSVLSV